MIVRRTLRCRCGGWQQTGTSLYALTQGWAAHLATLADDAAFGHEAEIVETRKEATGW